MSGATGYRLDVATRNNFTPNSFVNGYNNLDVGNATSRSVTGLNANTTYYYRVRAYNARRHQRQLQCHQCDDPAEFHSHAYSDAHFNSNGDANINSDSATTDTHTNINTDSTTAHSYGDTDSYVNANADGYSYTNTRYSLSTNTDNRPYQGSQHTVQFHGPGKPH